MGSLIRASNFWGYDELVRELGGEPCQLLSRFHLPPAEKREDDSFLLYHSAARLLEASAVELKCPDFGMRLAMWQGLEMLGPIAVIARNSSTVLDACLAIARYLYVHCPALQLRMVSPRDSSLLQFDYRITELSTPQLRQSYELSMANAMQILRMLTGGRWCPEEVSFLHGQMGSDDAYAEAFGCEVRFEQAWCGWQMSRALGDCPIDHADAQTLYYATAYLESQFEPGVVPLSARVAELIRRLLPTAQCNVESVAGELAMHPRTLQRRLADDGLRYEALLDHERRALAERYLGESGLHLVQVAGLLGYSEQSTLSRACRRWFGMTPKRYRQQRLQEVIGQGARYIERD